jgi:mxaJ protein
MSSLIVGVAVLMSVATAFPRSAVAPLRVCADPSNLPFTNDRGEGFENHLANLLARVLGTTLRYTWRAQRGDFVNMTLLAGDCDVVMGYPTQVEIVATTKPYYRSTYVFVTRRSRGLHVRSYDDPALTRLRIGVQFSGEDGASSPPAQSLGRRGVAGNLVGFLGFGDDKASSPPSAIISRGRARRHRHRRRVGSARRLLRLQAGGATRYRADHAADRRATSPSL